MNYLEHVEDLRSRGYAAIDHERIREGQRVRNYGHQYPEAYENGTATVLAAMEKNPSPWADKYRARDIEVIVQSDDGSVGVWANYGTAVIEGVSA